MTSRKFNSPTIRFVVVAFKQRGSLVGALVFGGRNEAASHSDTRNSANDFESTGRVPNGGEKKRQRNKKGSIA